MRVYEAIGETLKKLEVQATFGLMGDGNLRFMTHLAEELGIPYYAARHEGGAVSMADGYARVSGKVGVCSVTQGPGVTNTLTALTEARKAHSPLLLLAGDTSTRLLWHNQDVDQTAIFRSVGVEAERVRTVDTVVVDVARAFNRALSEQRPIAMSIPTDVQDLKCDAEALRVVSVRMPAASRPSAELVSQAAQLIAASTRPAIIAGRGAVRSGAREPLERLAADIGAVLATTAQAKGLFAGNPFYVGGSGGFSSSLAEELLGEADLILAFGASLNYWTTRNREIFSPSARIVQCDIEPASIGLLTAVELGLEGDAAATAEALCNELSRRGAYGGGFHTPEIRKKIAAFRLDDFEDQGDGRTVDPRALMLALDSMLPRNRTVVIDSGHSMGWAILYLSAPDAQGFVFSNDFMAVGLGLGTAFGAAVARPDRLTVLAPGDGGMMMSLGELETFIRYKIPFLVVVINDAAYGAEVHLLKNVGLPNDRAFFRDNDFAAIATAMGAQGITVRSVGDLDQLRSWLDAPRGTMVLDCKVDPQLRGAWFGKVFDPDGWYQRMCRSPSPFPLPR
jgi:thiamine pyrophosphate-dependent acetolactate synthase large subunit-like protein